MTEASRAYLAGWRAPVPTRATFVDVLRTIQERVRRVVPATIVRLRERHEIRLHGARDWLAAQLERSEAQFESYFRITAKVRPGYVLDTHHVGPKPFVFPAARDAFDDGLWSIIVDDLERGERRLIEPRPGDVGTLDDYLEHEDPETSHYMQSVAVARFAMIAAAIDALPYARLWDDVDGDAGYWLGKRIAELSNRLDESPVRRLAIDAIGPGGIWHDTAISGAIWPVIANLAAIPRKAEQWREGGAAPRRVSSLGTLTPFEFASLGASPGVAPEILFGRARLREIVAGIEQRWRSMQPLLPPIANRYRFAVNAATLAHGGRHPPHVEHRDGVSVDLDLQPAFPVVERRPGGDYSLPGRTFDEATNLFECAVAFSACLLLSFPQRMLYASTNVTLEAINRVIDGFDLAINEESGAEEPDATRMTRLIEMRQRIATIDPFWGSGDRAEQTRRIHANHWHLSYRSSSLGPEPGFAVDNPSEQWQYEAFEAEVSSSALRNVMLRAISRSQLR